MTSEELPLAIQTFENIIQGNFIYVDKTDLVYKVANGKKFNFLSRPRRFGKSLLISTLHAYFEGREDLFRGLKIADLEKEWVKFPVFRFDLNNGKYQTKQGLEEKLKGQIERYEKQYKITKHAKDLETRFENLILKAYEETGKKVVVLVDEYEKPILETINNPDLQEYHRSHLKPFYGTLKSFEKYIHFAMLTGVTRMGHLSIFSDLNFFYNISLEPKYATICGFTEQEMKDYFSKYISSLCKKRNWNYEDGISKLRKKYDGYRFSSENIKVYNPYSLLYCFDQSFLRDYWFATGTPSFLIHVLRNCHFELDKLEGIKVTQPSLTDIDDKFSNPIPLFYQSGYLTITDYEIDEFDEKEWYTLNYPNEEVRNGFFTTILAFYTQKTLPDAESVIQKIVYAIRNGNPDELMTQIKSIILRLPTSAREKYEYFYRDSVIKILKLIGISIGHEVKMLNGDIDCVIEAPKFVYIIEFKVDKSVEEALKQIDDNNYAVPYEASSKKIFKIGVNFTSKHPRSCQYRIE